MNVTLFVSVLDQVGGAEIATFRLAQKLAKHGHQIVVLTTQSLSTWRQRKSIIDYTKGVRIIRLPVWQRNRRIFTRILLSEARLLLPHLLPNEDVLQLRGLMPETVGLAQIARQRGIKTVCVPMASGAYGDVAKFPSPKHSRDTFDWVSALTEPSCNEVIDWGFPAERTSVIPNGVDLALFQPPASPCVEPSVIFVGQFRPEKRVDLLLQAWQIVARRQPRAQLTLVGGGRKLSEYERSAARLGISVSLVPNTDAIGVLARLQKASIFVQPGISEGMSNALLEAMAAGLAVVVSDTPANRAVVTHESNGLTYTADSAEALAAQLERLLTDIDLRLRLGTSAQRTIVERYSLDDVTEQYLRLYARLLGESGWGSDSSVSGVRSGFVQG